MKEIKMDGKSLNILEENISKLKMIFPEVITEDKIDFEKLQNILGNYIDPSEEKYRFTWKGKMAALRASQTPSLGTLRPCKEKSKNWNTTQNIYIEGDNLEVLKLLQNSYLNKIKVIYIDPPYNTGKDFVYKDNFTDSLENYKKITGQIDNDGNVTSTNTESSGRYHTNWLNMMYPRLRLAKNLLADDGIILVSIDEHELNNLIMIMNEIFGETNHIETIVWNKKTSAKGVPPITMMVNVHEYIVAYQKRNGFKFVGEKRSQEKDGFKNPDNDPRGPWRESNIKSTIKSREEAFTITDPKTGKQYTNTWAFSKESLDKMIAEDRILWKESLPKQKEFMYEMTNENKAIKSSWGVYDPQSTTVFLKHLLPEVKFDNPKPISLMEYLIQVSTKSNDLILDFFSGSATTAHAIMKINAQDNNGNRKYIMVQLPEQFDIHSEAYSAGYKNICDAGEKRIWLVGDEIKNDINKRNLQLKSDENLQKIPDIGFKVFKLDTSNIKKWNPETDDLENALLNSVNNYVDGRTEDDVLYEIMLKCGIRLDVPIEELNIQGKKVYSIGKGAMIVCLDDDITIEVANAIVKLETEFDEKDKVSVVFKDNGFANDSVKTNIKETLRGYGIERFITI